MALLNRFVNATVIGLVAFFLVVTGVWLAVRTGAEDDLRVEHVDTAWGAEATVLHANVTFRNTFASPASLERFTYALWLDDQPLDEGAWEGEITIPPDDSARAALRLELGDGFATRWWESHLANHERSAIRLEGTAVFTVDDQSEQVPVAKDWPIETDLETALTAGLARCPDEPSEPCFEDVRATWDDAEGLGALDYLLYIRNPHAAPADVSLGQTRFTWNGILLAEAEPTQDLRIAPGGLERLELRLPIDGTALEAWWPTHVGACEETEVVLSGSLRSVERPEDTDSEVPDDEPPPSDPEPTPTPNPSASPSPSPSPSPTAGNDTNGTGNDTSGEPSNRSGNDTGNETTSPPQNETTDDENDDTNHTGNGTNASSAPLLRGVSLQVGQASTFGRSWGTDDVLLVSSVACDG